MFKAILFSSVLCSFLGSSVGWGSPADSLSIVPQDGHHLFTDNIDQARVSIDMFMYHLSDLEATQHLLDAQKRGVQIRLILDDKAMLTPSSTAIFKQLEASGISVRASSPEFSITHAKAASFDGSSLLVTSINLTRTASFTRDFGIKTFDASAIQEFESVFAADWDNAANKTHNTPDLSVSKLVWSPLTSAAKLLTLIGQAKSSLYLEVENLSYQDLVTALITQAKAGVKVVVVVPACAEGGGTRNFPVMRALAAGGVDARLSMPPYSEQNPYIHAKAIVVDQKEFYVGSENFSFNSLTLARELGLIETDPGLSKTIAATIAQDAALASSVSQVSTSFKCEAN